MKHLELKKNHTAYKNDGDKENTARITEISKSQIMFKCFIYTNSGLLHLRCDSCIIKGLNLALSFAGFHICSLFIQHLYPVAASPVDSSAKQKYLKTTTTPFPHSANGGLTSERCRYPRAQMISFGFPIPQCLRERNCSDEPRPISPLYGETKRRTNIVKEEVPGYHSFTLFEYTFSLSRRCSQDTHC